MTSLPDRGTLRGPGLMSSVPGTEQTGCTSLRISCSTPPVLSEFLFKEEVLLCVVPSPVLKVTLQETQTVGWSRDLTHRGPGGRNGKR